MIVGSELGISSYWGMFANAIHVIDGPFDRAVNTHPFLTPPETLRC